MSRPASRASEPQPVPQVSPLRARRRYERKPPKPTLENLSRYIRDAGASLGDDDPLPMVTELRRTRLGTTQAEARRVEAVNLLVTFARTELANAGPRRFDAV